HDDGARGMDAGIRCCDVRDVVGHDGSDDATGCGADTAVVRPSEPRGESRQSSVRTDGDLCCRLPGGVGRVQHAHHRPAMGIGTARLAIIHDDDDELLAWRCNPYRRPRMAAHPGQSGVPAALPLATEFSYPKLAAWPARRLSHGARARHLLFGVLLVFDGS